MATAQRLQTFVEFLDSFTTLPPEHIPTEMAVSDVLLKASTDDERRVFEGWGTVEIKDRQGDLIPIEAFEPLMKKLMKRGAPILDSHSNRHVGKVLDYKFKQKNGKKGLWLKGEIFDDFSSDNQVWQDIKRGLITGFSLGGRAQKQQLDCDYEQGECVNKISDLEVWEWSVVRRPANPEATIEAVNKLAKEDLTKKMSWDECVRQMKDEYGSEDKAYAVCNGLASEGKVEPCPERKMMDTLKSSIISYAKKKNFAKLDAQALLEKCTHCRQYVNTLKMMGVDENSALSYLQKKLDEIIVEEKHKMSSVNVKVQQPVEEKQEEEAPAQAPDMQAVLEEIMKRLSAIEEIVFPKETSMDSTPTEAKAEEQKDAEKQPSEIQEAVAKELKKFFDKLGVSSTQRPLEKSADSPVPSPKINLKDLSYSDIARLRLEADPIWQRLFLKYDTR